MRKVAAFVLLIMAFSFAGRAEEIKKEFTVKPGQKLDMDLQCGGKIIITGWDQDKVSVTAELRGRDGRDGRVDMEEVSTGISITCDYERRRRNSSSDNEFRINVPKKFDLDLSTAGGRISVDGVEGTLDGTTMGGELDLTNLGGTITFKTMGGGVTLTKSNVDGEVSTMGGKVLLRDVVGNVSGHSMGGAVTYDNVTDRKGKSSGKEVVISTMGGEINVDQAPYGADVQTMGGDISIHYAEKHVKAKTMGGNIEIDSVNGGVHAETMGGDVIARMVGDAADGDRDVYITSKGGEVRLVVPDALSMAVDITLAYTRDNDRWRHDEKPRIISDFDLQKDETDKWEHEHGSARKYIYGKGSIAGGKNKIHIETINGNVYLKKASTYHE